MNSVADRQGTRRFYSFDPVEKGRTVASEKRQVDYRNCIRSVQRLKYFSAALKKEFGVLPSKYVAVKRKTMFKGFFGRDKELITINNTGALF